MKKYLSIDELAEVLKKKKSTIYKYVSAKKIDHIKIGSRVLFDPDEIEKWIMGHTVKAVS